MTAKKFLVLKIAVAIFISVAVSAAITAQQYFIPIPIVIIGATLLHISKKRVKDVMEDERDFEIAGKSARYSMNIFAFLAVGAVFMLLWLRNFNPYFDAVAATLSYSVCFLLILYSLIFKYLAVKESPGRRKFIMISVMAMIFIVLAFAGLRIFSGEDDWICSNGKWIEHGHPDFPAPTAECK
jgi:uncharacterized membrane protein